MTSKSKSPTTRRIFLKQALSASIVLGLSQTAKAESNLSYSAKSKITLFYLERCIGCGACVMACQEQNSNRYPEPQKPIVQPFPESRAKIEDWSDKKDLDTRLTPYNWLYIQEAHVNYHQENYTLFIPRRCMHCNSPICASTCPFGAMQKQETSSVTCDPKLCMGGAKCRNVCPWAIPQRQSGVGPYLLMGPLTEYAGNGVMYKCDRCNNIVARHGTPACIEICPENVQSIGSAEEILPQVEQAIQNKQFLYGYTEAGGTSTIYISPVPFELIQNNLESEQALGQGKPHFKEVPNSVTRSKTLATILFSAPIVGALAALLVLKNRKTKKEQ